MQTIADLWLGFCCLSIGLVTCYIASEEFWVWREKRRVAQQKVQDGHERLLEDLICGDIDPNVQAIVYKTKTGSTLQWHVPGKTDEQIVQHLTESSLFKRIA